MAAMAREGAKWGGAGEPPKARAIQRGRREMTLEEAVEQIITDGIGAAKKDYKDKPAMLKGSVNGFNACKGKNIIGLTALINTAREKTSEAFRDQIDKDAYWEICCFELEVEWVCNVASAILMNNGLPVIIEPTCRGVMRAAEIVEVNESQP